MVTIVTRNFIIYFTFTLIPLGNWKRNKRGNKQIICLKVY